MISTLSLFQPPISSHGDSYITSSQSPSDTGPKAFCQASLSVTCSTASSRLRDPWPSSFPVPTINSLSFLLDWPRPSGPALFYFWPTPVTPWPSCPSHLRPLGKPHIHSPWSYQTFSVLLENNIPVAQMTPGITCVHKHDQSPSCFLVIVLCLLT